MHTRNIQTLLLEVYKCLTSKNPSLIRLVYTRDLLYPNHFGSAIRTETNLTSNIARKDRIYQDLIRTLQYHYNNVKFKSLSVSTLGVLSSHSTDFITMLGELSLEDRHLTYIQRKIYTINIRSTYYIFCRRGQDWTNPELLAT